jgi:hypothetical protein
VSDGRTDRLLGLAPDASAFSPRHVGAAAHVATFLLCGLFVLAVRVLFIQDPVLSDDMGYWCSADGIAAGDFRSLTGGGYATKRWGITLFVAVLIRLFGASPITYYFLPGAAAFVSGGFAYLIGRRVAGWTEGVVGAVLYGLLPLTVITNGLLLLPDAITSAWMAVAFWSILRSIDRPRPGGQVLCGLAAGCCVAAAYACRITAVYVLPVLGMLAIWRRRAWALLGLAIGLAAGLLVEFALFGAVAGQPLLRYQVAGRTYYRKWSHHNRVEDVADLLSHYTVLMAMLRDRLLWWKLSLGSVGVLVLWGRRRQHAAVMWFAVMVALIHLLMRLEGAWDFALALSASVTGLIVAAGAVYGLPILFRVRRRWSQPVAWWLGGLVTAGVFLSLKRFPAHRALVHQARYFEMAAIPGCLCIAMALRLIGRRLSAVWTPLPLALATVVVLGMIAAAVRAPHLPLRSFAEHPRTVMAVLCLGSLALAGLAGAVLWRMAGKAAAQAASITLVAAAGLWAMLGAALLASEEPRVANGGYAWQIGRRVSDEHAAGAKRIYCHNYLDSVARIFAGDLDRQWLRNTPMATYDRLSAALDRPEAARVFPADSVVLMDLNELRIADSNRRRRAAADGAPPPQRRLSDLPARVPANWQLLDVLQLKGAPRILIWRVHAPSVRAARDVPVPNGDFVRWPHDAPVPEGYVKDPIGSSAGEFTPATTPDGAPAARLRVTRGRGCWLLTGTQKHSVPGTDAIGIRPDTVYRLTFRAARPAGKLRVRMRAEIHQYDGLGPEGRRVDVLREGFDVWTDWSTQTYAFRTHPRARYIRVGFTPHGVNEICIAALRLIQSRSPRGGGSRGGNAP